MKCSECAHESHILPGATRCKLCSGRCRRCGSGGHVTYRSAWIMCPACWTAFVKKWTALNLTRDQVLARFPHICAHIICSSLGYATPNVAAMILKDALTGQENWCEWIYSCYQRNPGKAVAAAIEGRQHHKGYMAEIRQAVALVKHTVEKGEPSGMLASWF